MTSHIPQDDHTTRAGAERLAFRIANYWAERGHSVKIVVSEAGFNAAMRSTRFDLRSDMVNGWPRARG